MKGSTTFHRQKKVVENIKAAVRASPSLGNKKEQNTHKKLKDSATFERFHTILPTATVY